MNQTHALQDNVGLRGPLMDALSTMKHWLTVGVTASPAFKVRNWFWSLWAVIPHLR